MASLSPPAPPVKPPRAKPARTIRLALAPLPSSPGVVSITAGKRTADYFLTRLPSDFGEAYRLDKFPPQGAEVYHVLLSDEGTHSCECKGFLRWGRCKHADGLAALKRAGRL
jgi:hypothetical protein